MRNVFATLICTALLASAHPAHAEEVLAQTRDFSCGGDCDAEDFGAAMSRSGVAEHVPGVDVVADLFDALDTNDDGRLSSDEIEAGATVPGDGPGDTTLELRGSTVRAQIHVIDALE